MDSARAVLTAAAALAKAAPLCRRSADVKARFLLPARPILRQAGALFAIAPSQVCFAFGFHSIITANNAGALNKPACKALVLCRHHATSLTRAWMARSRFRGDKLCGP